MKLRLWGWLLFPVSGFLLAVVFMPSEWRSTSPDIPPQPSPFRKAVPLPDGTAMRFVGIPDERGGVAFWLGERELSRSEMRALRLGAHGDGVSAALSFREAEEAAAVLAEQTGLRVRLPTLEEWQHAARGGVRNAETPWGFGLHHPPDGLMFSRSRAPDHAGPSLGFGFRDMAGGLWEWTAERKGVGGAWSERDPATLRIDHAVRLPDGYKDMDIGARLLIEAD